MVRGLPWERLLIVKNKYNRRVLLPTDTRAYIKTGTSSKFEITTRVTSENGVMLSLTGDQTRDLPAGSFDFDVYATISGVQRPVCNGIITVSDLDNITPLEDTQDMEIRFKKYTDFRESYSWEDDSGNVLVVQDAYMQAEDEDHNTVLDLRWYSSPPSEQTISGLTGNRRGYIAPKTGATLEIRISDTNTIPVGTYNFDLMVKTAAGDWLCKGQGMVVVEYSVSSPPV